MELGLEAASEQRATNVILLLALPRVGRPGVESIKASRPSLRTQSVPPAAETHELRSQMRINELVMTYRLAPPGP